MREFINNTSLAIIINLIVSCLLMILSEMMKEPLPQWVYITVGGLSAFYTFSRKENWA